MRFNDTDGDSWDSFYLYYNNEFYEEGLLNKDEYTWSLSENNTKLTYTGSDGTRIYTKQ